MSPESIIALVISGCMLAVSVLTFIINSSKSSKKEVIASENRLNDINQSLLKVNLKLDQVCATTADIRSEIRTMQNKQIEHTEQIAKLEAGIETAFLRIDELRENIKHLARE